MIKESFGRPTFQRESAMTRLKFSEIVVIILALLGGLGFFYLIGARFILLALTRATGESGGTVFAISGGISTRLFTFMLFVVLALVAATAVALWRR
jgi:hypothetical protein